MVELCVLLEVMRMLELCVFIGFDDVWLFVNSFVVGFEVLVSVVGENVIMVVLIVGEEVFVVKIVDGGMYFLSL